MVAVTGKKVGKGGECLVQVLTQGVEFTLDGSGGGLLLGCCGVPRVPGRSKVYVNRGVMSNRCEATTNNRTVY